MKKSKIPYWASHLTTIVSVALVLIIIGCIAMISVFASRESRNLRENVEMTAIMRDSVTNAQAEAVYQLLKNKPWVKEMVFASREEVLAEMNRETGDDIEKIVGVNFLSPEITFSLKADYCDEANIKKISKQLLSMPEIDDVGMPDAELIESMNTNIETLTLVFGAIALVMIVISIVLINNTVRLSIYSRRFTIHTMQLVGATKRFIQWPFIKNNIVAGIVAAIAADAVLAAAMVASWEMNLPGMSLDLPTFAVIAAGLLVIGILICACAAAIATSKYLNKNYNQLFE